MFTYSDYIKFLVKKDLVNEFFEQMYEMGKNEDDESTVVVDDYYHVDDSRSIGENQRVIVKGSNFENTLDKVMKDYNEDEDEDQVPSEKDDEDEDEDEDQVPNEEDSDESGSENWSEYESAEKVIRNGLSQMSRRLKVPSEFYRTIRRGMNNEQGKEFKYWMLGIPPIRSFVEKNLV